MPWAQETLLKQLLVGVTIWHVEQGVEEATLRFVYSNPAGERLTGQASADCLNLRMSEVYGDAARATYAPFFLRAMTQGEPVELDDVVHTLPDGEQVQLRIRLLSLGDGYVASEYSNVAAQVATTHDLARRTQALMRSNRELEEFAAAVSHDLREPLRKVVAFGRRLHSRAQGGLDDRSEDYLQRMVGAAERMQQLIDDLLTLSRVRVMGRAFVERPMAIIVAGVLDDLEVLIEQTGGQVTVGLLPRVSCDPTQVRQLVQNLVGNALKFHKPNEAPQVRIEQILCDDEGWVGFVVEDDGIGFETRFADQIFGLFQRLHGRTAYPGSGLGLAVCKRIVERHGGRIIASSTLGHGARFEVYLPAETARTTPA